MQLTMSRGATPLCVPPQLEIEPPLDVGSIGNPQAERRVFGSDRLQRIEPKGPRLLRFGQGCSGLFRAGRQPESSDQATQCLGAWLMRHPKGVNMPRLDTEQSGQRLKGLGAAHEIPRRGASEFGGLPFSPLPSAGARLMNKAKMRARS